MRASPAAAVIVLVLAGCSTQPTKSPCEGLVYTDAGLTREQYAPCAKAMVGQLDEIYTAVETILDKSLPKQERMRARTACLKASSDLARLMKQAGGTYKLMHMAWDDTALSRFNRDVESARSSYFLYCYYGAVGPPLSGIDSSHGDAKSFASTLP